MSDPPDCRSLEGIHASMAIARPSPTIVVLAITGSDVGELGDAPFRELNEQLEKGPFALFVDARRTRGASVDVSNLWASWLRQHRDELIRVHMLAGSHFVRLTADFVRRFAGLGDTMLVYTEPSVFDETLESEIHLAGAVLPQCDDVPPLNKPRAPQRATS